MITYDSHRRSTLLGLRGSVLPKAMLWALPSALAAYALKYVELQGHVNIDRLTVLTQGDIYSGFTYVLGFSLVFRTSQSYLRYWVAATSVHEMGSEWSDSCASLISFATISKAPFEQVQVFNHTVVRLFSLLHATALSEIASISEELPLLDIQGLSKEELLALTSSKAQGRKVQIVLCWIKTYIVQMADQGLLSIPAPILTRVFQELGAGLVNFHKSQQIVIWPFPFPYTQLNLLLIQVYTILTPLVVSTWETWAWMCFVFTFISVTCMFGLDFIASELENPFGDDPNDLPVLELQNDMNKFLSFQLAPVTHRPPHLLPSATQDYKQLLSECRSFPTAIRAGTLSLEKRLGGAAVGDSFVSRARGALSDTMRRRNKHLAQLRWVGRVSSEEDELHSLQRWLGCRTPQREEPSRPRPVGAGLALGVLLRASEATVFSEADHPAVTFTSSETSEEAAEQDESSGLSSLADEQTRDSRKDNFAGTDACTTRQTTAESESKSALDPLIRALREELSHSLSQQLELQKRQLNALEALLRLPTSHATRFSDDSETQLLEDAETDEVSSMSDLGSDEGEFQQVASLPSPMPKPVLLQRGAPAAGAQRLKQNSTLYSESTLPDREPCAGRLRRQVL